MCFVCLFVCVVGYGCVYHYWCAHDWKGDLYFEWSDWVISFSNNQMTFDLYFECDLIDCLISDTSSSCCIWWSFGSGEVVDFEWSRHSCQNRCAYLFFYFYTFDEMMFIQNKWMNWMRHEHIEYFRWVEFNIEIGSWCHSQFITHTHTVTHAITIFCEFIFVENSLKSHLVKCKSQIHKSSSLINVTGMGKWAAHINKCDICQ